MAWQKSGYSMDEIAQMKRDAERRVEEMRRRSQELTRSANLDMGIEVPEFREPPEKPEKSQAAQKAPSVQQGQAGLSLDGLVKAVGLGGDRLMIFLLVVLLINEHADPKVILALMWIII